MIKKTRTVAAVFAVLFGIVSVFATGTALAMKESRVSIHWGAITEYFGGNLSAAIVLLALLVIIIMLAVIAVVYVRASQRQQEAIRESERFLSYICAANDNVSEYNLVKGTRTTYSMLDGKVLKETASFKDVTKFFSDLHPDDRERAIELFMKTDIGELGRDGSEIYYEVRAKTKQGIYEWYAFTIQGLRRDPKHPANVIVYKRNINDLKYTEELQRKTMAEALTAAKQASAAKTMFLSQISHEIRTPLSAIIGYTELAENHLRATAEESDGVKTSREYMEKISKASRHLLTLLNEVLDMSAQERGYVQLVSEPFSIEQLINSTAEMFTLQARDKGLFFNTVVNGLTENMVIGDSLRLKQILINLLSNAIKFTPQGGRVAFEVTQMAVKDGQVYLRFVIRDTGIGIERSFLPHIFDPFEQQDKSFSRKFGGSGLGLAIAKNFVEMMQGVIMAESVQGEGTFFRVDIPFGLAEIDKTASESETDAPFPEPETKLLGAQVLVVEDNEMNLEIAATILRQLGLKVDCASDGIQALELWNGSQQGYYRLIFMDIQMPNMNGYDAVKSIRNCRRADAGTVPIIALTANAFSEDISACIASGMNDCMTKPIDTGLLIGLMNKYL